ncbi:ArsR/SmtB family transcription factor [Rhodovibrionaceae bacterium A322]
MDQLLQGLKAAAEATRLRILGLCSHAELTVSELVEILGQSQPRVSRHLKLLVEAGLLERHQEGSWAFYRQATTTQSADLARVIVDLMPQDDAVQELDLKRLEKVKAFWAVKADAYFRRNAITWEKLRELHVDQAEVDTALRQAFEQEPVDRLLDLGTGAGHILTLLGDQVREGVGIDRSLEMLNVARSNVFRAGLSHCQVRHGDMNRLPYSDGSFDAVTLHMVLHFSDNPVATLGEVARVLRPGGRLMIVDFAEHDRRDLRDEQAHRWLGFESSRMSELLSEAGLSAVMPRRLEGGELTVCLWEARRPANDQRAGDTPDQESQPQDSKAIS